MQPGGFFGEHRRGFAPRHPVLTIIHLIHERLTGGLEFGEGAVVAAEVGAGRDEVGFGDYVNLFWPQRDGYSWPHSGKFGSPGPAGALRSGAFMHQMRRLWR